MEKDAATGLVYLRRILTLDHGRADGHLMCFRYSDDFQILCSGPEATTTYRAIPTELGPCLTCLQDAQHHQLALLRRPVGYPDLRLPRLPSSAAGGIAVQQTIFHNSRGIRD
jgi:hypothetical protein